MNSEPVPSRVTAALIPYGNRIFIAQRPPQKKFGLLWEFPGGKVESGESLEESLVREIEEELCWEVQVSSLFHSVQCRHVDLTIDLYAFWCFICGGKLCLREHVAYHWAEAGELRRFGFTQVDHQLIMRLQELPTFPRSDCSVDPSDIFFTHR